MIKSSGKPADRKRPRADSALRHLVASVPVAALDSRAGPLLEAIRARHFDSADSVVIVDSDRRVAGLLPTGRLLELDPATRLAAVMRRDLPVVHPDTDQERIASLALHHGLTAVPVVDSQHRLVGLVPSSALLAILRREHVEDLHRLAGIARENEMAREALEAPPARRARHRLPWLLVGLVGSIAAAVIMAQFESLLAANLAIAFFVPGIVYLADAIGTQTEAITVRGLSLSHAGIRHMLAGELRTGLFIGGMLGVVAFAVIWPIFGDAALASAVAVALFVAGGIATTVGLLLPWLLGRLGWDPAYGSGPLATIVQDVLSITIYLSIAQALLY